LFGEADSHAGLAEKLIRRPFVIPRATRAFHLPARSLLCCLAALYLSLTACQHTRGTATEDAASRGVVLEGPKAVLPEVQFDFGVLTSGAVIGHDFLVRNEGRAPLSIQKVSMTTPLLVTRMPREVAPGSEGKIHFELETTKLAGKFDGLIILFLNDAALRQAILTFTGHVIPPIELSPMPSFFVAGQRGHGGRGAIEIVNREPEPLHIEKVQHRTDRFTTQLETLKQGQRYRLNLTLRPDGPLGKNADTILVSTSSKKMPSLKIDANTYLYERVHTFPELVALGTLRANNVAEASLTLMIYQEGGNDFQLKLSTDIPGLSLKWERGPEGDRYQAKITLNAEKMLRGAIKGSIFVDTNDPQFPRLIVPVYGQIVEH